MQCRGCLGILVVDIWVSFLLLNYIVDALNICVEGLWQWFSVSGYANTSTAVAPDSLLWLIKLLYGDISSWMWNQRTVQALFYHGYWASIHILLWLTSTLWLQNCKCRNYLSRACCSDCVFYNTASLQSSRRCTTADGSFWHFSLCPQ
jgi:hypothetical protein